MENLTSLEIIKRMKKVLNVLEDQELADCLGIKKSKVANWKRGTSSIDTETLIKLAKEYQVSLDWLFLGQTNEQLDTAQQMALLAFNALDEKKKLEAIAFMSGLKNAQPNSGINLTANGSGNNQQIFHGNISEVTGIKK